MRRPRTTGFVRLEGVVVAIVATILLATIVPELRRPPLEPREGRAEYHLHTLRALIDRYRVEHAGEAPSADLHELVAPAAEGRGPDLDAIPANPLNGRCTVKPLAAAPPTAADADGSTGWLYHPPSGAIHLNDAACFGR